MKKACLWLKNKFESLDFHCNVFKTNGHPIIYAKNLDAGNSKPTVLIYGHYDVQSAEPLSEWTSDPFTPEIRSGNIYCRGVADDKGQLYTWIAAIEELKLKSEKLGVNLKFIIEGEEEIGSTNFENFVEENKSLLTSDVSVAPDTHCLSETQPLICYGLRGLVYTEITIKTLAKDVHSGICRGNIANPIDVLAGTISNLKESNGKIKIPSFYDQVRKLSQKELSKFPFQEQNIITETGAINAHGEKGFSIPERAGSWPTLDVNGTRGGYIEEGQKTIIPGSASAKISMRLVPFKNQKTFSKNLKDI